MSAAELHIENGLAALSGPMTFSTVPSLYQRMQAQAKTSAGMPSSVDLSDVSRVDSAGLALLLEWYALGRQIEIRNPPEALLKIARLCDAEQYFQAGASQNPETASS